MYFSLEQNRRIHAELEILRSGKSSGVSLCQYGNLSCVRCCLPHIGEDSHMEDDREKRRTLLKRSEFAYRLKYSGRYLGPGNLLMKFRNFNPVKDPRIEASQYEDSFEDVGKAEMERRFSERRRLFLDIYDRKKPRQSLDEYIKTVREYEGYRYKPPACSGPGSMIAGGFSGKGQPEKGELPECHLLGFVDAGGRIGCMAHPLAEMSRGYDGRDRVGFFHHSGCCENVGCEASREFVFLSPPAMKVFDRAVEGMSWYEYSRHAVSVLVYYLRSYEHVLQRLDERGFLESPALKQLVSFTNFLYDTWPIRMPVWCVTRRLNDDSDRVDTMDILSMEIPLAERVMYIALDTRFRRDCYADQLKQAREHLDNCIRSLS